MKLMIFKNDNGGDQVIVVIAKLIKKLSLLLLNLRGFEF